MCNTRRYRIGPRGTKPDDTSYLIPHLGSASSTCVCTFALSHTLTWTIICRNSTGLHDPTLPRLPPPFCPLRRKAQPSHISYHIPNTSCLMRHRSYLIPHTSHLIPHTSRLTPQNVLRTPHTGLPKQEYAQIQIVVSSLLGGRSSHGKGFRESHL